MSKVIRALPALPAALFCGLAATATQPKPDVEAGSAVIVADATAQAFSLPVQGLTPAQLELFANGRQEFNQRWVVLPNIGGKWGRGPTSNGEICTDCHAGNGRGRAPESDSDELVSMVVRLSVPGEDAQGSPLPHPAYGDQLQVQGELGRVPPEGRFSLEWETHEEQLADGSRVPMRRPKVRFHALKFGNLEQSVMTSARVAPPVVGAGLLDAVSESAMLDIAQRQKVDGLNGRPNYVWDAQKQALAVGRFGWKANQPDLRQQLAAAFIADMGVTTSLFARENCPAIQVACRKRPGATVPEQADMPFEELVFYSRALAAPAQRNVDDRAVQHGERLFAQARCTGCHLPELRTGDYPAFPLLANQLIRPYTDLLLHDMGEGLADGRPDYKAGPRDWRTAPLWGIGLNATVNGNATLLHDGRARTLTEAILWHGGEAEASRESFRAMARPEREALLAFLASL